MKLTKPVVLRVVLPAAGIVLLMLWMTGVFHRGVIQGNARPVSDDGAKGLVTATVTRETIPGVAEVTGTVGAEQSAAVSARVVATIVEVRASAGQRVGSGDTLVVLDDRDFRRRVEQAREAVNAAAAAVAQAQSDYRRDKPLFDQKVISPFEFERTETGLKTAEANLNRLKQAEQEAEVGLSHAVVRSPFAGVIVDRLANVGDMAAPGKPLLTIYQQGRLWLEASVPEETVTRLHVGDSMLLRIDARDDESRGKVAEIVPSSDPATRTVAVRVRLEDARGLVPGMFGRLLVPAAPEELLTVPASAVVRAGQLTMTDVVEQGRVQRRTVQLGRAIGDRVEVYSGLAAGETVVLRGAGAKEKP